jgi:hypothetical protein
MYSLCGTVPGGTLGLFGPGDRNIVVHEYPLYVLPSVLP